MIEYRGREMPCFMQRQKHRGGCDKLATFRAEGPHVFMHLCDDHAKEFERNADYVLVPLAPIGMIDTLAAKTADPEGLLAEAPWVLSANGIRRSS